MGRTITIDGGRYAVIAKNDLSMFYTVYTANIYGKATIDEHPNVVIPGEL
jgi:hypothetical protein